MVSGQLLKAIVSPLVAASIASPVVFCGYSGGRFRIEALKGYITRMAIGAHSIAHGVLLGVGLLRKILIEYVECADAIKMHDFYYLLILETSINEFRLLRA